MKNKTIKNIFILLLCVFVLIPLVFILFDIKLNFHEGLMNRVDISGELLQSEDGTTQYTGLPGEHLYCPGGEISCPNGQTLVESGTYTLPNSTESGGITYKYMCVDTATGLDASHVQCSRDYMADLSMSKVEFQSQCKDEIGNFSQIVFNDIGNSSAAKNSVGTSAYVPNANLDGFIDPFAYVPMSVSGDLVHIYSISGEIDFTSSKCSLFEPQSCLLEASNNNLIPCETNTPEDTESESSTSTTLPVPPTLKCVADNNTKIGEPLCCGQTGVVQNTKYNCPSEYPYCTGYKCGDSWGRCVKDPSSA